MAERIKGITIQFNGDTRGLSRALSNVRKESQSLSRELREIDRELKWNPNNINLLSQKQQVLTNRVKATTAEVTHLKAEQKRLASDPSIDKNSAEWRQLEREIIKAEGQLKRFSREMVTFGGSARLSQVSDGLTTVGKKLTNVTRYARVAAGALAGLALYKGFERLKTLDEVSTSLEKLGYEGEKLTRIMDDTKASVSGTKFTLTDMAKVAQGALGSGVEKKYPLNEYLGRVSDLAQVAGISVTDMGAMMNKALSKGTVDAKLLNQMNANGIPIYTLLAEHLGVTTEELQKMVRTGQVGFDELYKATEKYNGLAQEMGTNTFSGAVTVLGQQFSLIGADFLSGAYEPIKDGVKAIVAKLKELQADGTFKEWGQAVGEAVKYFVEWFKEGEASMDGMSPKAQKLAEAFGPLIKILGTLVKFFIDLPAPMKTALALFVLFGGPVLTLAGGLLKIVNMASGFVKLAQVLGSVSKAFALLTGINPIVLAVVAAIGALVAIGVVVYKNWDKIKEFLITCWNAIKEAATTIFDGIKAYFIALFTIYKTIFTVGFNAIKTVVTTIFNGIKNAITKPIQSAANIIKSIVDKIKSFFNFKIKLPKIKLPHFSIKPRGWKFSDLLEGSIPSLGIDWYAKGGIFKSPSVIGVGEKGPEAVLPIEKLNEMLSGMADNIVNGITMGMALQTAGMGGEITIQNYLYPSGPKMGEETVKMYDTYKNILG